MYLSGIKISEAAKELNAIVISLNGCWNLSSNDKQECIKKIFNITDEDIKNIQLRPYILFTQCLSEDGMMSEEEKVSIYRDMLKDVELKDVVIKVHPREITDYSRYFPNCYIFDKRVPMQLLSILGAKFKRSYTICSTAAVDFDYPIESVFLGSEIHPAIVKGYGVIRKPENK